MLRYIHASEEAGKGSSLWSAYLPPAGIRILGEYCMGGSQLKWTTSAATAKRGELTAEGEVAREMGLTGGPLLQRSTMESLQITHMPAKKQTSKHCCSSV